ncbi:Uncharacterised protein [Bacillus freudenreichii]|nr:Uncharacterised protein [Bacillus freudenreichii]
MQAKRQDKESFDSVTSHEEKALAFSRMSRPEPAEATVSGVLRRRRAGRASATEATGCRGLRRPGAIGSRLQATRKLIQDDCAPAA